MWLYHGPLSREKALQLADEKGYLIGVLGDDGLTVGSIREVVSFLSRTPMGDSIGYLVLGPVDEASSEAMNALLKTLEDGAGGYIQPILWANDIGGVLPTILSRCHSLWCPQLDSTISSEFPFMGKATTLCEAALRGRRVSVIEFLAEHKGQEVDLVRASVEVLAQKEEWPWTARVLLWSKLRELLLSQREPTPLAVLVAYLSVQE